MKTVLLKENKVREIIPDYALPVEKWYGAAFAAECMEAPYEVEEGWVYDPETGAFSTPAETPEPEPEQTPDVWDELAAAIREGVNDV